MAQLLFLSQICVRAGIDPQQSKINNSHLPINLTPSFSGIFVLIMMNKKLHRLTVAWAAVESNHRSKKMYAKESVTN